MKKPKHLGKVLLVILGLLIVAQPALAAPLIDYSATDINWWDERGNNVCGDATLGNAAVVKASDNEKTIFYSMLSNGFSKQMAAAALGNLQQESNFNPKATQSGGPGRGIVQWSVGGRWDELQKWAGTRDIWALDTQIQFMFYELTHGFKTAFNEFKSASSLADQTSVWANKYEIAGIIGPRLQNAQAIMQQDWFKAAPESTSNGSQAGTNSVGGCSATGGASQYIDGWTVYSQYDPRWKNHPYGTSTIGPSGCGPTAMAMIITNLTGKSVLPPEVADWAANHGMQIPGSGSSWQIGPVVAQHYGLTSKAVGTDLAKINAALRAGSLIIISGQGSLPFTSAGHFIVIRAVTSDGKWLVGDSAHAATNTQKFDPQGILSQANAGSAYAISK